MEETQVLMTKGVARDSGIRAILKHLRSVLAVAVIGSPFIASTTEVARAERLRSGGTGATTMLSKRLCEAFAARNPGITLEVISGLGTSGAIEALADGVIDFAIAARELKPEERARSLTANIFARTPFGLVSSYLTPPEFSKSQLIAFYANPGSTWPDGTPVKIILRPRSDSDTATLATFSPNMDELIGELRKRSDIPIAATDQDNAVLAASLLGSLTTMTFTQAIMEYPNLHFLTIDDVEPTVENLERGRYSYQRNFYLVVALPTKPTVEQLVAFVRSSEGKKILLETGNLPVPP